MFLKYNARAFLEGLMFLTEKKHLLLRACVCVVPGGCRNTIKQFAKKYINPSPFHARFQAKTCQSRSRRMWAKLPPPIMSCCEAFQKMFLFHSVWRFALVMAPCAFSDSVVTLGGAAEPSCFGALKSTYRGGRGRSEPFHFNARISWQAYGGGL